ncbi:MAG: serine O-acetyltransferase [Hyphomicrobiales bacterium]|jgi:serine O-acetyltransferase|nr:serine O-acetyltransferase [Hyphomicrobiales bacterium]
MAQQQLKSVRRLDKVDPVWTRIRDEAEEVARREPELASFIYSSILHHDAFEQAVVHRIAERLDHPDVSGELIRQAYADALEDDPGLGDAFRADIAATIDRDPAAHRFIDPLLYFKGFHAIQTHRLAHWLWIKGRKDFALYLQSRSSAVFQTDINPNARIGRGIFLDHATGLVVGETAAIDDDVSILHGVTLGGTGKENEDRHPKIRRGVMIGAGAKILGNIEVGHCARIAAGSVVLKAVPPNTTVAGVPAKVVGEAGCAEPSRAMDQMLYDLGP